MYAYSFEGYWKDVGTISSLWEANMDLLGDSPILSLNDESWRIFSRYQNESPQYVGPDAHIENSTITEGCEIGGTVINSVLGEGVKIMEGAIVKDSVVMSRVTVGKNAVIEYSILDEGVTVGEDASIGKPRDLAAGITVVGSGVCVPDKYVIGDNEMIAQLKEAK